MRRLSHRPSDQSYLIEGCRIFYHTVHSLQWGKERAHMMMLLREMVSKDQIAIALEIYSHTQRFVSSTGNMEVLVSHTHSIVCVLAYFLQKKSIQFLCYKRYTNVCCIKTGTKHSNKTLLNWNEF